MTTISVPTSRRRRIVAGAALALTVVMAAGCSSSTDQKSSGNEHLKRAAATKPAADRTSGTTAAPTASSTTAAPAAPECTDAAAQSAMSGVTVTGVSCAAGYAAGSLTDNASGVTGGFMLKAVDGQWQQVSGDALSALCKTDLPPALEGGCYDS